MRPLTFVATAAVVVTATIGIAAALTFQRMEATARAPVPSFQVGDTVPDLPGVDYSRQPRTVLMPISSKCDRCDNAIELYRAATNALARTHADVKPVWLSSIPDPDLEDYLRRHDLPVGKTVTAAPVALRLRALPSVAIIDSTGKITQLWSGRRALDRQQEILAALAAF